MATLTQTLSHFKTANPIAILSQSQNITEEEDVESREYRVCEVRVRGMVLCKNNQVITKINTKKVKSNACKRKQCTQLYQIAE